MTSRRQLAGLKRRGNTASNMTHRHLHTEIMFSCSRGVTARPGGIVRIPRSISCSSKCQMPIILPVWRKFGDIERDSEREVIAANALFPWVR